MEHTGKFRRTGSTSCCTALSEQSVYIHVIEKYCGQYCSNCVIPQSRNICLSEVRQTTRWRSGLRSCLTEWRLWFLIVVGTFDLCVYVCRLAAIGLKQYRGRKWINVKQSTIQPNTQDSCVVFSRWETLALDTFFTRSSVLFSVCRPVFHLFKKYPPWLVWLQKFAWYKRRTKRLIFMKLL